MTLKGGTSQACAACKYQRRKCTPECPLAPYFPPDQPKMFQNVHKLFGVKKIQRMLQNIAPHDRSHAMTSIVYQANARELYPVGGCVDVIRRLQAEIYRYEQELLTVQAMLSMYRQQHEQQQQQQQLDTDIPMMVVGDLDTVSPLQLGMAPPDKEEAASFYIQNQSPPEDFDPENVVPVSQNISFSSSNSPQESTYNEAKTLMNSMWITQPINDNDNDNDNNINHGLKIENVQSMPVQSQLVTSQESTVQQEDFQKYDDMRCFFDPIDDRQSYFTASPEYEESNTTHCHEHVAENELKNAAACFTLTSVN